VNILRQSWLSGGWCVHDRDCSIVLATFIVLLGSALGFLHCGGAVGSKGSGVAPAPTPGAAPLLAKPVVVVLEENEQYEQVIGSPSMPYFNSLAQQYALAANYYANGHNSLPNYFMLTTGQFFAQDGYAGTFSADNVVRELTSAGHTWKAYMESLPAAGYMGGSVLPYDKDHDPFSYFTDVLNDSAQQANVVPFTQFAIDLANHALPDYAFVAPNDYDNSHSCPAEQPDCTPGDRMTAADTWLQSNIGPLLSNPQFAGNGLLVVVFDESLVSDTRNGGGHVALVMVGPHVNQGFVSNTFYQHPSALRLSLSALGINNFPGVAASAPDMSEFLH